MKVKVKQADIMALACHHRRKIKIPRVQVIGSSGKTTTKEMIGAVLRQKYNTLLTRGNHNAPTGVARTLLQLRKHHEAAVLEVGMKSFGIMRQSTRMIRPTIGVVTSIHEAHRARFAFIQGIIRAKAEMLEYLAQDGTLIINGYDKYSSKYPYRRFKGKVVRFGFSPDCDIWASDVKRKGLTTRFIIHTREYWFPCMINIIGRYNVGNALAAAAVGLELGLKPEEISRGLASFYPVRSRLRVFQRNDGATIIDDNYNANPESTRLLVEELISLAEKQQVLLVLGDMERPSRDIEKYARRVHRQIGRQLAQGNFTHVLAVGLWAKEYLNGAIEAGFPREKITYYRTVQAAEKHFKSLLTPETIAVLKASPYTRLRQLRIKTIGLSAAQEQNVP